MNYRPLGQGLAGLFLLAHATYLYAAANDAIQVESLSNATIILPADKSLKSSVANAPAINSFDNGASVDSTSVDSASADSTTVSDFPRTSGSAGSAAFDSTQPLDGYEDPNNTTPDMSGGSLMRPSAELLPFQAPTEDGEMAGIEDQYQQQLLQQEVQNLRGLVEELQFQLQRMKKTQDDRYLELDARFQALRGSGEGNSFVAGVTNTASGQAGTGANAGLLNNSGASSIAVTGAATSALNSAANASVNGASNVTSNGTADTLTGLNSSAMAGTVSQVPAGQSEKDLYDTALELIRNRQYDVAITQLQAVIDRYPEGDYAPNAYYWLGEVYAARPEPDLEKARQALAQVVNSYPGHRKVPDAAFKLGKVYHLMGDCDKSRDLLSQVADQQQGKTVGKLATSYLRDSMIDCQQ